MPDINSQLRLSIQCLALSSEQANPRQFFDARSWRYATPSPMRDAHLRQVDPLPALYAIPRKPTITFKLCGVSLYCVYQ